MESTTDCSCHRLADLGGAFDRFADAEAERAVMGHLADAFASLGWIVGANGQFQIIMHVRDPERFRALGPHQEELPATGLDGPARVAMRVIEFGPIRVVAFCAVPA